jgi:hypothetical protein
VLLFPPMCSNGFILWHGGGALVSKKKKTFFSLFLTVRVARWYIMKPKIPLWVNFGGPQIGKCWYI